VFSIPYDPEMDGHELKKAIKTEDSPAFDHIDAADLLLWKVGPATKASINAHMLSRQIHIDPSRFNEPFIKQLDLTDEKVPLEPWKRLSNYWGLEPPTERIHVIVQAPNREYASDSNSTNMCQHYTSLTKLL
jgi:hypothetical protein